jgi:hypothetical protein
MSSALLKLIQQRKSAGSERRTSKLEQGRHRYRILPSWRVADGSPEADQFWMDFGQHYIKDASGKIAAVYMCKQRTFGTPCEVCDAINLGMQNSTDDLTLGRLKDAKAGGRVLVNMLHLDGPNPNEPQVFELPPSVFDGKAPKGGERVGGITQLFSEWPNLVNLKDGVDIIIEKSGTGLDTAYGIQVAGSSKPVNPDVMKKITDLDKYVDQQNAAAQSRALTAVASVSGYLPAPSRNDVPTTTAPLAMKTVGKYEEKAVEEVPFDLEPTVAPSPTPAAPAANPASAAPAAIDTGDEDLDALLRDL